MTEVNILRGPPLPLSIVDADESFGLYLLKQLKLQGDIVVQVDGITGATVTASKLLEDSIKLSTILCSLDVKTGDVIGISSENHVEFGVVCIATLLLGAAIAPLNITYTKEELHHALGLSKPKLMFCSALSVLKVAEVVKTYNFMRKIILIGEKSSASGIQTLHSLINDRKIPEIEVDAFDPPAFDALTQTAAILCSSGTTGLPKGVELTHSNIKSSAEVLRTFVRVPHANPVALCVLPFFHSFGMIRYLDNLCNTIKQIVIPKFEGHLFLQCIQDYKITMLSLAPPLLVFLAKSPLVDEYDLTSVREIGSGAAPLSKAIDDAVTKRLQTALIFQGYGMTETTLGVLLATKGQNKPGSVGGVVAGTQGKVIDLETGIALGPNQRGELCFKGVQIMKGYVGDQKATDDVIDKDKWLHTGDIGYYDEDGSWFVVDRLKELIKYKGFQVPPAELEAILLTHWSVKDAAVIGLPDLLAGELPLAFVVKQPNQNITERELQRFVAGKVSPAKRLHGGVRFIKEIPKTASGKILRRHLRDLLTTFSSKL